MTNEATGGDTPPSKRSIDRETGSYDSSTSRNPVLPDGGQAECVNCGGTLPEEIEPGTGVYCPECGHGQHVPDGGVPQPDVGDRVTYYDDEGDPHRAIVVDAVRDAEYISCVTSDQGELGEDYTHSTTTHTSVYPHADLGENHTATAHAFKLGWSE